MSTTTRAISNQDDVIDSRDVIDRLEELAGAWAAHANGEGEPLDDDDTEELRTLTEFANEAEEYAEDWIYGAALIRDSYFEDYARELAEDCAPSPEIAELIRNDGQGDYWPLTCARIDWVRAADDLRTDYAAVDFAGVTYWVR